MSGSHSPHRDYCKRSQMFQNTNASQTGVVRFCHAWGNPLRPRFSKAKSATGSFSRAPGEFSAPFLAYGENSDYRLPEKVMVRR
jgi:hypothetical protein